MQIQKQLSTKRTLDRFGKYSGVTLNYRVSGGGPGDHLDEAVALVCKTAPESIGSCHKKEMKLSEIQPGGIYEIEVVYARLAPTEEERGKSGRRRAGDRNWSFEVITRSVNVTEAKELISSHKVLPELNMPEPGNLIGWDGRTDENSRVSGASVLVPEIYERCVATYREGAVNNAFRRKICALAGKVNNAAFHGWEAGEVLLLSAEQSTVYENDEGTNLVDVTYKFAIRPRGERMCGGVRMKNAAPWNVLWYIPARNPDKRAATACGVYESRVYDSGNFSNLHI